MNAVFSQAWLVTGSSGQVGNAVVRAAPRDVRIVAPSRADLDLADPGLDVGSLLAREGITAIVNCAAYTYVDRAESEEDLALQINGAAPGLLGQAAARAAIPVVHVSTDYVFAGTGTARYSEDDAPAPRTAYGRSKLAGELALQASGACHAIVRTAWVFSASGHNFVETMLRLGRERDEVSVVADQFGCPTHAGDLAKALVTIATAFAAGDGESGTWHVTNAGDTSWYGLAARVFQRAEELGHPRPALKAVTTADYPTAAARPANSRLATAKVQADFGIVLRPWETAVDEAVEKICRRESA